MSDVLPEAADRTDADAWILRVLGIDPQQAGNFVQQPPPVDQRVTEARRLAGALAVEFSQGLPRPGFAPDTQVLFEGATAWRSRIETLGDADGDAAAAALAGYRACVAAAKDTGTAEVLRRGARTEALDRAYRESDIGESLARLEPGLRLLADASDRRGALDRVAAALKKLRGDRRLGLGAGTADEFDAAADEYAAVGAAWDRALAETGVAIAAEQAARKERLAGLAARVEQADAALQQAVTVVVALEPTDRKARGNFIQTRDKALPGLAGKDAIQSSLAAPGLAAAADLPHADYAEQVRTTETVCSEAEQLAQAVTGWSEAFAKLRVKGRKAGVASGKFVTDYPTAKLGIAAVNGRIAAGIGSSDFVGTEAEIDRLGAIMEAATDAAALAAALPDSKGVIDAVMGRVGDALKDNKPDLATAQIASLDAVMKAATDAAALPTALPDSQGVIDAVMGRVGNALKDDKPDVAKAQIANLGAITKAATDAAALATALPGSEGVIKAVMGRVGNALKDDKPGVATAQIANLDAAAKAASRCSAARDLWQRIQQDAMKTVSGPARKVAALAKTTAELERLVNDPAALANAAIFAAVVPAIERLVAAEKQYNTNTYPYRQRTIEVPPEFVRRHAAIMATAENIATDPTLAGAIADLRALSTDVAEAFKWRTKIKSDADLLRNRIREALGEGSVATERLIGRVDAVNADGGEPALKQLPPIGALIESVRASSDALRLVVEQGEALIGASNIGQIALRESQKSAEAAVAEQIDSGATAEPPEIAQLRTDYAALAGFLGKLPAADAAIKQAEAVGEAGRAIADMRAARDRARSFADKLQIPQAEEALGNATRIAGLISTNRGALVEIGAVILRSSPAGMKDLRGKVDQACAEMAEWQDTAAAFGKRLASIVGDLAGPRADAYAHQRAERNPDRALAQLAAIEKQFALLPGAPPPPVDPTALKATLAQTDALAKTDMVEAVRRLGSVLEPDFEKISEVHALLPQMQGYLDDWAGIDTDFTAVAVRLPPAQGGQLRGLKTTADGQVVAAPGEARKKLTGIKAVVGRILAWFVQWDAQNNNFTLAVANAHPTQAAELAGLKAAAEAQLVTAPDEAFKILKTIDGRRAAIGSMTAGWKGAVPAPQTKGHADQFEKFTNVHGKVASLVNEKGGDHPRRTRTHPAARVCGELSAQRQIPHRIQVSLPGGRRQLGRDLWPWRVEWPECGSDQHQRPGQHRAHQDSRQVRAERWQPEDQERDRQRAYSAVRQRVTESEDVPHTSAHRHRAWQFSRDGIGAGGIRRGVRRRLRRDGGGCDRRAAHAGRSTCRRVRADAPRDRGAIDALGGARGDRPVGARLGHRGAAGQCRHTGGRGGVGTPRGVERPPRPGGSRRRRLG